MTLKQRRFCEFYQGNGVEASRKAGYNGSDAVLAQIAYENMRKPDIRNAIEKRVEAILQSIATNRLDRQIFFAQIFNDKNLPVSVRLRVCELLSKIQGDFVRPGPKKESLSLSELIMATVDSNLE